MGLAEIVQVAASVAVAFIVVFVVPACEFPVSKDMSAAIDIEINDFCMIVIFVL
jgi:hypothetical protein